jgi:hypothetical protein
MPHPSPLLSGIMFGIIIISLPARQKQPSLLSSFNQVWRHPHDSPPSWIIGLSRY